MAVGRFEVRRRSADHLELVLSGSLEEATVLACEAEVKALLCLVKQGGVRVLVDLLGAESYSLAARDRLVSLQQFLGEKALATAFLVGSSTGRSLALWLAHMTQGQVIKSFARQEDATAWLGGGLGPTTGVRPISRSRDRDHDPESLRPKRKTAS